MGGYLVAVRVDEGEGPPERPIKRLLRYLDAVLFKPGAEPVRVFAPHPERNAPRETLVVLYRIQVDVQLADTLRGCAEALEAAEKEPPARRGIK